MTANQLRAAELMETKRANVEREAHNVRTLSETTRANKADERIRSLTLGENQRHNIISEGISRDTLTENQRRNLADEAIRWGSLHEQTRHNTQSELVEWGRLNELNRSNLVDEDRELEKQIEYERHNRFMEGEARKQLQLKEAADAAANPLYYGLSQEERTELAQKIWKNQNAQRWVDTAVGGVTDLVNSGVKIAGAVATGGASGALESMNKTPSSSSYGSNYYGGYYE